METPGKNRILYIAGAVFFAALFVADGIDMTLQWDSYTIPKVIRASIHMLVWILMTWYCADEFKVRQRRNRERHYKTTAG